MGKIHRLYFASALLLIFFPVCRRQNVIRSYPTILFLRKFIFKLPLLANNPNSLLPGKRRRKHHNLTACHRDLVPEHERKKRKNIIFFSRSFAILPFPGFGRAGKHPFAHLVRSAFKRLLSLFFKETSYLKNRIRYSAQTRSFAKNHDIGIRIGRDNFQKPESLFVNEKPNENLYPRNTYGVYNKNAKPLQKLSI